MSAQEHFNAVMHSVRSLASDASIDVWDRIDQLEFIADAVEALNEELTAAATGEEDDDDA